MNKELQVSNLGLLSFAAKSIIYIRLTAVTVTATVANMQSLTVTVAFKGDWYSDDIHISRFHLGPGPG